MDLISLPECPVSRRAPVRELLDFDFRNSNPNSFILFFEKKNNNLYMKVLSKRQYCHFGVMRFHHVQRRASPVQPRWLAGTEKNISFGHQWAFHQPAAEKARGAESS